MSDKFTPQQIQLLRKQFDKFDDNGDETISTKELGIIMRSLGQNPSQQELQDLIDQIDTDDNGTIDFSEFMCLMSKKMKNNDNESQFKQAFDQFDVNKDGFISASDLKLALQQLFGKDEEQRFSPQQIDQMLQSVDIDKDAKINFKQFLAVLMAL